MRHNKLTVASLALTALLLTPGTPALADDRGQVVTDTSELALEMAEARVRALAEMRADVSTSIQRMAVETNTELAKQLAAEAGCPCRDTPCHDAVDGECRWHLGRTMPEPLVDGSHHLVRR